MKLLATVRTLRMAPEFLFRLAVIFLLVAPHRGVATGVVTNCSEADLRAALVGGGMVTFACDGTVTLTNTLVIAQNVAIDASGRQVTLSGGGAVRLFEVNSGVQLTLNHMALVNGYAVSLAGALWNDGTARLIDCTLSNNEIGRASCRERV